MVLGFLKKDKNKKDQENKVKNKKETKADKDVTKAKLNRTREEEITDRVEHDLVDEKGKLSKKE